MKKRIIYTLIVSLFLGNLFAAGFEGVITQEAFDVKNGKYTVQWHIKGDKIALEMKLEGVSYFFVPQKGSVLMYSNTPSEYDGEYYYSVVSTNMIESSLKETKPYETELFKEVEGYKTKSISIKGDYKGNVFYSSELVANVNESLANYFKDSYEFSALSSLGIKGLPLSSKISDNNAVISKITTVNILKQEVNESIYKAPSGYINLPITK